MTDLEIPPTSRKDWMSDQEVRWCPGCGDYSILAAVQLALEEGRNPDFIRSGAELNVVFVSDEDDHSPEEIETYIAAFQLGSGSGEVVVHSIVGNLPAGCASGVAAADPGTRYLMATEQTNGYADSICDNDYSEILIRIGLDLSGLQNTFILDDLPQPGSLEVLVEGARIPRREVNGWQYSSAENAIVFDGYAIPRPSMAITVKYELLSGSIEVEDTGSELEDTGQEDTGAES